MNYDVTTIKCIQPNAIISKYDSIDSRNTFVYKCEMEPGLRYCSFIKHYDMKKSMKNKVLIGTYVLLKGHHFLKKIIQTYKDKIFFLVIELI